MIQVGNTTSITYQQWVICRYKLFRTIMEFAKKFMTEKAEKLNGKAAMLGMFALVGAYYFTGQIVPGIF